MSFSAIMTSRFGRSQVNGRRLLALLAFAWLNLLIQPCLAEPLAAPESMVQCDHDGAPHDAVPCAEMQATVCETDTELAADSLRGENLNRGGSLLALLTSGDASGTPAAQLADPGGGAIPLRIRYCTLRN